jgi:hypothetical protein
MTSPGSTAEGWDWFAAPQAAPAAPEAGGLAADCAACFSGPAGQRLLARLAAMTIGRALAPGAGKAALGHLEGQRALVLALMRLVLAGGGQLAPTAVLLAADAAAGGPLFPPPAPDPSPSQLSPAQEGASSDD